MTDLAAGLGGDGADVTTGRAIPSDKDSVRQGATDTIPGDATTAFTLTIGGSNTGNINFAGDRDWFAVTLTAGQSYVFTLTRTGGSPLEDPFLRLYDAGSIERASNDDGAGNLNSRIVFTPTTTGTFFLAAGGFDDNATGTYTVAAQEFTPLPTFTLDQIADQLTTVYWGGTSRTFDDPDDIITFNLTGLSAEAATLARVAFQMWDDVSGLAFQETAGVAQITLDDIEDGAFADSILSGGTIQSSAVNVGPDWYDAYGVDLDSYTYQTFVHEIGHALGLGHAGNYNGDATYGVDNHYANDSWAFSTMSYFDQADSGYGSYRIVMTPQLADIVAIQILYGADAATRSGNTVYGHNSNAGTIFSFASYTSAPAFTIYDAGGTDTLDASGYSNNQTISLVAETFSSIGGLENNIAIARGVVIENATGGAGNDIITGNDASNSLAGGAGADELRGGGGSDFLFIDNLDTVVNGGEGYDFAFVLSAGGVTLDLAASELESVQGGAGNDILNGASIGAGLNLALNGMGGADQLSGGAGNDTIFFDHLDTVVSGGAGTDFAWANGETVSVTVNLASQGLEIVWGGDGSDTLNAAGVAVAVQINGFAGNDIITGGSANNILIGGDGADQITGGGVGDQLYFDHLDTVVVGGGGFDYAYVHNALGVSVDYATQGIEAVFGGFFDDILDASGMSTTAYLLGNTGADQLRGGSADDIVWFDDQDTVLDGGGGYNFAFAYNVGFTPVSMNLATQHFDTAWGGFGADVLDASGKTTSVVLVGLGGADHLTGGSGDDTLSAGSEDDILKGGAGDDTIFGEAGTGDVAVYDGVAADYSVTLIGTNIYTVTHTATGDVDTIFNVEFLRFLGGGPDVAI